MRAYQIGTQEGLSSLTLTERADLVAGPGQAVLKVSAVTLNHRDLLIVSGKYGAGKPNERTPVSDGVGVVLSVGRGVEGLAAGDRVTCGHFSSWIGGLYEPSIFAHDLGVTKDGWLAEQILVPAAALVKVPADMTDAVAVSLPAAGVTAWNALVDFGKVKAGDLVLTLGTGGVSMIALQLAKAAGARVAITSSSDDKLKTARGMGADITVNYKTHPDWEAQVVAANGGRGADIIVETGGSATLSQSITAAGPNCRIVLIGGLGGAATQMPSNFGSMMGKNIVMKGITAGSRQMLVDLMAAVQTNGITPVIDKVFTFDEAPAAYEYLKSGAHLGKVMIKVA